MKIETTSFINEQLKGFNNELIITVEHGKTKLPYGIDIACISEWLSEDDFNTLAKCIRKAQSLRKQTNGL